MLEASAGTGKTFTIANLVARYVADGVAMEELLVVSFSRESTRELRERVRERLVSRPRRPGRPGHHPRRRPRPRPARRRGPGAHRRTAQAARRGTDGLRRRDRHHHARLLPAGAARARHRRRPRHRRGAGREHRRPGGRGGRRPLPAQVGCGRLGAGGHDPGRVPRAGDGRGDRPRHRPAAPDRRPTACPGSGPASRRPCAPRSTGASGASSSSTTTTCCCGSGDTLTDPTSGPVAKARLRARYRVVLVDEFQDTDPVQWAILREAFHGHRTLVLIGDPKQAIYGFRGADVHAYLEARASAPVVRTLPTNYRSDAPLLDGMAAVFGGAALGDERIRVLPVEAAHDGRLVDAAVPLQLRVRAARRAAGHRATALRDRRAGPRRGRTRPRRPGRRPALRRAPAAPARRHRPAAGAARRHRGAGAHQHPGRSSCRRSCTPPACPSCSPARPRVFATPAAAEWQRLLEALEQPHRTTRVRRVALTCFVGLDAAGLDARR